MSTDAIWSLEAVHRLREMAREGLTLRQMSLKLDLPMEAVSGKLAELGIKTATEA